MSTPSLCAPPLKSQLAAIAIVAVVFGTGALLYLDYEFRIDRAFDDRDRRLLAELAVDNSRIRIVGIGTSLLQQATLRGDELSMLGEEMNRTVRYARLCRPAGRTPGRPDLMAEVAEANPDVVILEKTYLYYRLKRAWRARRYLKLCRTLVRQAVSPTERVQLPPDPHTFLRNWNRDLQQGRTVDEDIFANRRHLWSEFMTFGLRPGSIEFFRDLADHQTIIVVVELPEREGVPSAHSDGERTEMEASLRRFAEEGPLTLLNCPLEFDDGHFLDHAHLNPKGQKRFSRWLFDEVTRLVAPDSIENHP